eukprot:gb/GFBE01038955.1/.p1 GENE.gb/GFBE01038955.1/~~gb/GFBE01038955.1/.p1  ORF type:complete len:552 (+),score=128.11 gb/GFBE01038955.1/:1-1656(+)
MALQTPGRYHRSRRGRGFLTPAFFVAVACAVLTATRLLPAAWHPLLSSAFANGAGRPLVGLLDLKKQLRQHLNKAAIVELEKTWRPLEAVTSSHQLQGRWRLLTPKESGSSGLLSGDVPRMLLNLYAGNIGRMLSMEVVSPPILRISPDGRTKTETELRWGGQHDQIFLQGQLTVVGPNQLRETPKTTRSLALKFTMPAMQPERDIKITYYDEDLLIVRDNRGIVDVLWRDEDILPGVSRQHLKLVADAAGNTARAVKEDLPAKPANQVNQLADQVQSMTASLEALQNQSLTDQKARDKLAAEAARLEKQLEAASVDARAGSVTLGALAKMKGEAATGFQSQEQKSQEQVQKQEDLMDEVSRLRQRAAQLETNVTRYRLHESSLKSQISTLEKELTVGARDAWPAYRAAVAKAREELSDVRGELKTSVKAVSKLQRELAQKSVQLQRMTHAVDVELEARQGLEARLEEQQREYFEATRRLSQAAEVEKALRKELGAVSEELRVVEQREAASKKLASEMEEELKAVASQVKVAKQAVKLLSSDKKRRFWPWR